MVMYAFSKKYIYIYHKHEFYINSILREMGLDRIRTWETYRVLAALKSVLGKATKKVKSESSEAETH